MLYLVRILVKTKTTMAKNKKLLNNLNSCPVCVMILTAFECNLDPTRCVSIERDDNRPVSDP